jgi:hypothetical protein|tara:strand:+ start:378 stop:593 length:216 start_codon:yes stop_codon:yes gene_type:complete
MTWFYLHCAIAVVVLIADATGTFEPTVKAWEKKLGIPVPKEQDESSTKLDSTSIDYKKLYIDAQRINNGHE